MSAVGSTATRAVRRPATVIDILAAGGADRIDEAGVTRAIGHGAKGDILADREIDRTFQVIADIAFADRVEVGFDRTAIFAQLRLVGDVAQRSADASRPEKGALRSAQRFNAVEVVEVEIGVEQGQRNDRFVEITPTCSLTPAGRG